MDFMKIMGQMGQMKEKMEEAKARLDTVMVVGEAQGVRVTITANKGFNSIDIDQALVDQADKGQLEDLIAVAFQNAVEKAENVATSEMSAVSQDMLPGMPPGMF